YSLIFIMSSIISHVFAFTAPATSAIYTLSLHDALPILRAAEKMSNQAAKTFRARQREALGGPGATPQGYRESWLEGFITRIAQRSEEHTSELQSPYDLVCRLLLEKKKKKKKQKKKYNNKKKKKNKRKNQEEKKKIRKKTE